MTSCQKRSAANVVAGLITRFSGWPTLQDAVREVPLTVRRYEQDREHEDVYSVEQQGRAASISFFFLFFFEKINELTYTVRRTSCTYSIGERGEYKWIEEGSVDYHAIICNVDVLIYINY